MKKLKVILSVLTLLATSLVNSTAVFAIDSGAQSGFKKGIVNSGGTSSSDVGAGIQDVVNLLLFVAGVIAVVVIVVAGLRFVLSNGDPGAASKARSTIIYAVVGLVVAIMAYAIVNFVLTNI